MKNSSQKKTINFLHGMNSLNQSMLLQTGMTLSSSWTVNQTRIQRAAQLILKNN